MIKRRQHPRHPMFLGEPSPALAKIQRMPIRELRAYVGRLGEEIGHVRKKIATLRGKDAVPGAALAGLRRLVVRLEALRVEAESRLGTGGYEAGAGNA
ncbi:MAG: hypothetical protein GC159_14120 [Phycisphaera sp.]|nr:hypothetical protein [Phycisphaera sp.]